MCRHYEGQAFLSMLLIFLCITVTSGVGSLRRSHLGFREDEEESLGFREDEEELSMHVFDASILCLFLSNSRNRWTAEASRYRGLAFGLVWLWLSLGLTDPGQGTGTIMTSSSRGFIRNKPLLDFPPLPYKVPLGHPHARHSDSLLPDFTFTTQITLQSSLLRVILLSIKKDFLLV